MTTFTLHLYAVLDCRQEIQPRSSPQISRSQSLYNTCSLGEPSPEDPVRVLEHAILQTDDDELGTLEPCFDQPPNILRVREIQCGIHLVQDVHRRRFELK